MSKKLYKQPSKLIASILKIVFLITKVVKGSFGPENQKPYSPNAKALTIFKRIPDVYVKPKDYYNVSLQYFTWGDNNYNLNNTRMDQSVSIESRLKLISKDRVEFIRSHCVDEVIADKNMRYYLCDDRHVLVAQLGMKADEVVYKEFKRFDVFGNSSYANFSVLDCENIITMFNESYGVISCYGENGGKRYLILGGFPLNDPSSFAAFEFEQSKDDGFGVLRHFSLYETITRDQTLRFIWLFSPFATKSLQPLLSFVAEVDKSNGNKVKFYRRKVLDLTKIENFPSKLVVKSIGEILAYSDIPYFHTLICGYQIEGNGDKGSFKVVYLDPPSGDQDASKFKVNQTLTLKSGPDEQLGEVERSQINLSGSEFHIATNKFFFIIFMATSYHIQKIKQYPMPCNEDRELFKEIISSEDISIINYRKEDSDKTHGIGIHAFGQTGFCFPDAKVHLSTIVNLDSYGQADYGESIVFVNFFLNDFTILNMIKEYQSIQIDGKRGELNSELKTDLSIEVVNRINKANKAYMNLTVFEFKEDYNEYSYHLDFGRPDFIDVEFGSWIKLPVNAENAFGEDVRYTIKELNKNDFTISYLTEIDLNLNMDAAKEGKDLGMITRFVSVDSDSYVMTKEFIPGGAQGLFHMVYIFDCDIFSSSKQVNCDTYEKFEFSAKYLIIGIFKVKDKIVLGVTVNSQSEDYLSLLLHFDEKTADRIKKLDYELKGVSLTKIESRSKVSSENGVIFFVGTESKSGSKTSIAGRLSYTYNTDGTITYTRRTLYSSSESDILSDAFYLLPSESNQNHHTLFELTNKMGYDGATSHLLTKARFFDRKDWKVKTSKSEYKKFPGSYSICATQKAVVFIFRNPIKITGYTRYYGYQSEIDLDIGSHQMTKIMLTKCIPEHNFFQILASTYNKETYLFNFNLDSAFDYRRRLHSKIRVKSTVVRFDSSTEPTGAFIYTTLTYREEVKGQILKVIIINTKGPVFHVNTAQLLKDRNNVTVQMKNSGGSVVKEDVIEVRIKPQTTIDLMMDVKSGVDIKFESNKPQKLEEFFRVEGPVYNSILSGKYNASNLVFLKRREKLKQWYYRGKDQYHKIESLGDWLVFLKRHSRIVMFYKGTEGLDQQKTIILESGNGKFYDFVDFEIALIPGDDRNIALMVKDNGKYEGYGLTVMRTYNKIIKKRPIKSVKNLTFVKQNPNAKKIKLIFRDNSSFLLLQDSPGTRFNNIMAMLFLRDTESSNYVMKKKGKTDFQFEAESWSPVLIGNDTLYLFYSENSLNKIGLAFFNFSVKPQSPEAWNNFYEPFHPDGKPSCNIFTYKLECWNSYKRPNSVSCYVNSIGIFDYFIRYTINLTAVAEDNQNAITKYEVLGVYTLFRNFEAEKIIRAGDFYGLMLKNIKLKSNVKSLNGSTSGEGKKEVVPETTRILQGKSMEAEAGKKINIFKCSHLIIVFHKNHSSPWTVYNCYDLGMVKNRTDRLVDFALSHKEFTRLTVIKPPIDSDSEQLHFSSNDQVLTPDRDPYLIQQFRIGEMSIKMKNPDLEDFDKIQIQLVGIDGDLSSKKVSLSLLSTMNQSKKTAIFYLLIFAIVGVSIGAAWLLLYLGVSYYKRRVEESRLARFAKIAQKRIYSKEERGKRREIQEAKERLYHFSKDDDELKQEQTKEAIENLYDMFVTDIGHEKDHDEDEDRHKSKKRKSKDKNRERKKKKSGKKKSKKKKKKKKIIEFEEHEWSSDDGNQFIGSIVI